jgi:hypothetical protein
MYIFWSRNQNGRDQSKDLGVHESIILEEILEK